MEGDGGAYLAGLVLLWLPLLILFICLTVKLNGQDNHFYTAKSGSMRLALIFIPFWIIEASVMVGSLLFLIYGIIRLWDGYLARLDEHIGLFVTAWLTMAPFLILQALLSARDDGHTSISNASSVSSILIVFGWFCLMTVVFAIKYRTPFEDAREQAVQAAAGSVVLFEV
jgi:hypothetical protein